MDVDDISSDTNDVTSKQHWTNACAPLSRPSTQNLPQFIRTDGSDDFGNNSAHCTSAHLAAPKRKGGMISGKCAPVEWETTTRTKTRSAFSDIVAPCMALIRGVLLYRIEFDVWKKHVKSELYLTKPSRDKLWVGFTAKLSRTHYKHAISIRLSDKLQI